MVREHRRSAWVTLSDWTTRRLRWSVGGGVDCWKGRGVFGRVGGSIERRVDGSRGALRIAADSWPASDAFGRIAAGLGWRSTTSPAATGVVIAAGATHVTRRSPLDLWPGAGTWAGKRRAASCPSAPRRRHREGRGIRSAAGACHLRTTVPNLVVRNVAPGRRGVC